MKPENQFSIKPVEFIPKFVSPIVRREIKLELSRITEIANEHARPDQTVCFRAELIKEVELGYRGDYGSVVNRLRETHPDWFRVSA